MLRILLAAGNALNAGFSGAPWNEPSAEWLRLDERLPLDHLARKIEQVVEWLDLTPPIESFAGVGKKAHRPDLMVKIVLYEMHSQRLSPAQWARDVQENEPLRWLMEQRQRDVQAALDGDDTEAHRPDWLADTLQGLLEQKERYQLAEEILQQRLSQNQQRSFAHRASVQCRCMTKKRRIM